MTITQPDVTALWKELQSRVDAGDRFAGLFATRTRGRRAGPVRARRSEGGRGGGRGHRHARSAAAAGRGQLSRAHPAARRRVLVRARDPRPLRRGPGGAPEAGAPHPARLGGRLCAAQARRGLRDLHDPARPGPLRRDGIDRVPGGDAGRGDPAPEHAGVLQAPRRGEPVRRDDRARTACCWPNAPRASPRSPTPSPSATRSKQIAGCQPPPAAALVRVLHAELERIANHLDVAVRLADAAGLAVATARLALHKERVLRLVSRLCGSRFGRGVVVPGGVSALPRLPPARDPHRGRQAPPRGHRRSGRADGHLLVPGPAARHRPADAAARPPARGARPGRQGRRVRRRRPAGPSLRRVPVAGRAARPRARRR